jgi:hypothetical protein
VSDFPPEALGFCARHEGVSPAALLDTYASRLSDVASFSMTGMANVQEGGLPALKARMSNTKDVSAVSFLDVDGSRLSLVDDEDDGRWRVLIHRNRKTITRSWLARLVAIVQSAPDFPGLRAAAVERDPSSMTSFVPLPPIAVANHAVLVTDAQVADAYYDPEAFWKVWDVEPLGAWKLCTRALDEIDEYRWLAYTFESTMALVRAARPGLSKYGVAYWEPETAIWWEFGDYQDEKGGYPALAPGDYDEATRTYDMIGFITKTPLEKGGEEPRHVLVREIHYVRDMVRSKRDAARRPVEAVRITFLEEWMARQERRPLLDAGARVYFRGNKTGELIEVKD